MKPLYTRGTELHRRGNFTANMSAMVRRQPGSPVSIPALPTITPVTIVSSITDFYSTAITALPAINAASSLPPVYVAPTISYVAEPLPSGSQPATVNPTATATLLGPCNYVFPPSSDFTVSTPVGGGALPTSGATTLSDGYTQLYDTTGTVQLSSADDGNLYLAAYPGNSPQTMFYSSGSVIIQDESQRTFHYYPDTMAAYNVSRLRVADLADTPLTSQLITLVPVSTSAGTIYGAMDTLGNTFFLTWCNAAGWAGSKIFVTKDYGPSISTLASDEVQWIVTGDEVTLCYPLLLTSPAAPLA